MRRGRMCAVGAALVGLVACSLGPAEFYEGHEVDAGRDVAMGGSAGNAGRAGSSTNGGGGASAGVAGVAGAGGTIGGTVDAGGDEREPSAPDVGSDREASSGTEGGAACPHRLCETFEGTADGAIPAGWEKVASTGTIGVASTTANRGSRSLHVVAPSGSYETYIRHTKSFPVPNNSFYGRLFFRIAERRHAPMNILHWTVVEARGSTSNNRVRYGGIENGVSKTNAWLFNVETEGMGEKGIDDDADLQVNPGHWYCAEWMYAGAQGSNEARLWIDGAERPKMHVTGATFDGIYAMPTFNALYVGWAIYQPMDGPYEVWIDDVALDTQKVGCAL